MADNFLEKRMEEYRNGGSGVVVRKHKMPRKRVVLVVGCSCMAHLDVVKSLCNGGHQVFVKDADDDMYDYLSKTLARFEILDGTEFDTQIINNGHIEDSNLRTVIASCMEFDECPNVNSLNELHNVNIIRFPNASDGKTLAKMVRFLVDSDDDIMNKQIIELL